MAWGDLCAHLVDGPAPAPFDRSDWPQPPAAAVRQPPRPYVVLHVGASSTLKHWPAGAGASSAGASPTQATRWRCRRARRSGDARPDRPAGNWTRFAGTCPHRALAPSRRRRAARLPRHRRRPPRAHRRRAHGRALRPGLGTRGRRGRLLAQEPVRGGDHPRSRAATSTCCSGARSRGSAAAGGFPAPPPVSAPRRAACWHSPTTWCGTRCANASGCPRAPAAEAGAARGRSLAAIGYNRTGKRGSAPPRKPRSGRSSRPRVARNHTAGGRRWRTYLSAS